MFLWYCFTVLGGILLFCFLFFRFVSHAFPGIGCFERKGGSGLVLILIWWLCRDSKF